MTDNVERDFREVEQVLTKQAINVAVQMHKMKEITQ